MKYFKWHIFSVLVPLMNMPVEALAASSFEILTRVNRFQLSTEPEIVIVTDLIIEGSGIQSHRFTLSEGSRTEGARAIDRATGKVLTTKIDGSDLDIELGRTLAEKAEQRLRIEERAKREPYLNAQSAGDAGENDTLIFEHDVPPGRTIVCLPAGYGLESSSVPTQIEVEAGQLKAGIINPSEEPIPVRFELRPGSAASSAPIEGSFRAEDDRNIIYWLEDPAEHRLRLALELMVDSPGQAHVYSILRKDDNITEPVTLDVDRGVELPTRIVSGVVAAAIGDSPTPIPSDADVLVADLGYAVPPGANARIRLYQTATDRAGYELMPSGELRWRRFLGRLRTRIVLPTGWDLTSLNQPALTHLDSEGRLVLDFVHMGGDVPELTLTAHRSQ